jgi:hypothetical protein
MSQNNNNLLGFTRTAFYLLLLTGLLLLMNPSAHAADEYESFDHFTTGFPLTGAHQFLDCSRCHIGGMFKGTPLECILCHNNSRAPGKHAEHITSSNRCDDCHTDKTWRGARFDHGDVLAPCESCHNNQVSIGKSPSHIASTGQCDDCHNTLTFKRVGRVDHAVVLGSCSSCHNGTTATGKSPQHITTFSQCDVCHNTRTWRGARFDHVDVTGPCSGCHNNVTAVGKPPTHLPTTDECNICHVTTGWRGATFDHSLVTGLCFSCHNGVISTGKSTTHFVTTLDCERCHSTARWIPLIVFRHDSANYPGDHRTGVICVDCHRTNNQIIAWPFPAYQGECAACHADDYVPGAHGNLPVSDVADCSGSCHFGGVTRSGEHRPSSGGW